MLRKLFSIGYLAIPAMILVLGGCSEDDEDNGVEVEESAAIKLTLDFTGPVSESSPIIVEIKDDKLADPIKTATANTGDAVVTIDGIPTSKDWVIALYQDEDNDGEFDELNETLVFYSSGEPDNSAGALGEASDITLSPGETFDAGTISFSNDE